MVQRERAGGVPVLLLDAGNALFKAPTPGHDAQEKARAELLLAQMEALGTAAMAVGARDLTLGADFLRQRTKKTKLQALSANLVDTQGKALFPASTVVEAGGVRVGLIGLSPEGRLPGAQGRPPVPAALAEAKRLRAQGKVDVVVVLAAVPYREALEVSLQGEGVDFVVQSGDNRGVGMAQRNGLATLIPPGERGRQLARLELSLSGPGPFTDLSEQRRSEDSLKVVEANLARTKQRLASTQDETARQALQGTLSALEARQASLRKTLAQGGKAAPRTQLLSYIHLGAEVPSDAAVQKQVERLEPPGSAAH